MTSSSVLKFLVGIFVVLSLSSCSASIQSSDSEPSAEEVDAAWRGAIHTTPTTVPALIKPPYDVRVFSDYQKVICDGTTGIYVFVDRGYATAVVPNSVACGQR